MNNVLNKQAYSADFLTPSATQQYALGEKVVVDVKGVATEYVYVKAHADLTQYVPYVVCDNKTAAPATAAFNTVVGVPQSAISSGSYGFVCTKGTCTIKTGAAVTKNYFVEVINAATSASSDGATRSANSIAVYKGETTSAAGNIEVQMLGLPVVIAAS